MIRGFFVNFALIVAALSFGNMILRDRTDVIAVRYRYTIGMLCGILGCLLLLFSVRVSDDVAVDFRCIPIMLMGLYCSMSEALISAVIISLFRLGMLGFNRDGVAAAVTLILIAVVCSLIGKIKLPMWGKWVLAYVAVSGLVGYGVFFGAADRTMLLEKLYPFFHALLIVCVATYFLMRMILKFNHSYFMVQEASNLDYLTGLSNVRHFEHTLEESISLAKRNLCNVSLLFLDIDHFKQINDTYGHLNGDRLLQDLGRLLLRLSRSIDAVARKGGDEFTVLLMECGLKQAEEVANRICREVEQYNFISTRQEAMKVTVSIGVASFPETTLDEKRLTEQADQALYCAKQLGRNGIFCADQKRRPLSKTDSIS